MAPTLRTKATASQPDTVIDTSKLSKEGKEIVSCIIAYFEKKFTEQECEIIASKTEIGELKTKIEKLENQIDDNNAYERRDTLVLSGNIPPSTNDENCKSIIINKIRDELHMNINANDISIAHRIGPKPKTQAPDKRSIIFKLCRRDLKSEILDNCRRLKPSYYINESLTPVRSTIMYVLRMARRQHPDKLGGCRTNDGSVSVYLPTNNRDVNGTRHQRITVNTKRALDDLLQRQLSCSSSAFIDEWRH